MAVFTGPWNDVELPLKVARGLVVSEDVARDVLDTRLQVALLGRVTHDDRVVNYDRGRRGCDVAYFERNTFIGVIGMTEVGQHVHHAFLWEAVNGNLAAEAFEWRAGLCV